MIHLLEWDVPRQQVNDITLRCGGPVHADTPGGGAAFQAGEHVIADAFLDQHVTTLVLDPSRDPAG
jgi:hypothetical protein